MTAARPIPRLKEARKLVGRLVFAEWLDSSRSDGWTRAKPESVAALACCSAGRLIEYTPGSVTIAGHWTVEESPQRAGSMTIPTRALVSLRALK